jgi:hypothetical protein
LRKPFAAAFDIMDLPSAAIFSATKEVRDLNNGKGFSPADFIKQTRNNISAIEALDLQRYGSWGKLAGLGLDVGVGIATMPGVGEVGAGAKLFARGTRVSGIPGAINVAERAINPSLARLGVLGENASEVGAAAAKAAAATEDVANSANVAARLTAGQFVSNGELAAASGRVRRLAIGQRTLPGTEGLVDSIERLKGALGKPALVKAFTRSGEGGKATSILERLDSLGITNSALRRTAIAALDGSGDMGSFLHQLELAAVRAKGVSTSTLVAAHDVSNLEATIKDFTGKNTVAEALRPLRKSADGGSKDALAWAGENDLRMRIASAEQANPAANELPALRKQLSDLVDANNAAGVSRDGLVFSTLNKTWNGFLAKNLETLKMNPALEQLAREKLSERIASFAREREAISSWTVPDPLKRVRVAAASNQDVLSSVVVGWLGDSASVSALEAISTPENIARIAMGNKFTNAGVDLTSTESAVNEAIRLREVYRDNVLRSSVFRNLYPKEKGAINAAARAEAERVDALVRGQAVWRKSVDTVEGVRNTFPEFADIIDPIQAKYVDLAAKWTDVKTVRSSLEGNANDIIRSVAAGAPGESQNLNLAAKVQEALAAKKEALSVEQRTTARRMNLARGQLNAAEARLEATSQTLRQQLPGSYGYLGVEEYAQAAKDAIESERRLAVSQLDAENLLAREATKGAKADYKAGATKVSKSMAGNGALEMSGLPSERLMKVLNTAGDADQAFMQATMANVWSGAVRWGKYGLMDIEDFKRIFAAFGGSDSLGKFTRHFQGVTNMFRSSAIASPGFSNRNFVGALINNFAHGVPLKTERWAAKAAAQYLDDLKRLGAEEALARAPMEVKETVTRLGDVQHAASRGVNGNAFAMTKLERGSQTVQGFFDQTGLSMRGLLTGTPKESVRVEFVVRLAAVKHFLDEGMNIEGAWARMQRIHFDYTDLSAFDVTMRRVVPFWTWTSRNLPAQAELLVRNAGIGSKLDMAMLNSEQRDGALPPWLKGSGFQLGGGMTLDMGSVPSADLLGLLHGNNGPASAMRSLAGQSVGPIIKTPIELLTGRELMSGRPISMGGVASNLVPTIGQVGRLVPPLALPGIRVKSAPSNPFLSYGQTWSGAPFTVRQY